MTDHETLIKNVIHQRLGISVTEITPAGKGASGSVFRVKCKEDGKTLAVKMSPHLDLMREEYEMLSLLREKTKSKVPAVYFFEAVNDLGMIAMEYVDGVSGKDRSLLHSPRRRQLAESIVDNLLLIQEAHGEKFGPYNCAKYDTWQAYYKTFAESIYTFSQAKYAEHALDDLVMQAVKLSYQAFSEIFSEEIPTPTLTHGDYWMPNFIIDKKSMTLLAAVDPFNILWADPEYELFALTVGAGKKLRLLKRYKNKVKTSKYCDVKLCVYALYSELLWYQKEVPVDHTYLKKLAKNLMKVMKKYRLL